MQLRRTQQLTISIQRARYVTCAHDAAWWNNLPISILRVERGATCFPDIVAIAWVPLTALIPNVIIDVTLSRGSSVQLQLVNSLCC